MNVIASHDIQPSESDKVSQQGSRNWKANLFIGHEVVRPSVSIFTCDVRLGTDDETIKLSRMYLKSNLQCNYWSHMTNA